MAAGDARWNPIKATAYRVTFPILDADGDLVTGATGLDSEVSKDGVTFTDCTNEATEIATNSGIYYLDLTATEMDADTVTVVVKTSSSGAKSTPIIMYPLKTADLPVNVVQISGDSVAADNLEAAADGTGFNLGGGSIVAASVTARVTANTDQLAGQTVTAAAGVTFPTSVASPTNITAGTITTVSGNVSGNVVGSVASVTAAVTVGTNNDKTGYSLATTPPTAGAIADAVWDEATAGHTTAGTYGGRVLRGTNSNVEVQVTGSNHIAADMHESQPGTIHATTFDAGAIDAAALATDAVAEIVSSVLTTQMTEGYRATNAAPTLAQALFELIAHMGEAAIVGTTKTLRKIDGSTTAKTYTLDSSTTPTSITEAT